MQDKKGNFSVLLSTGMTSLGVLCPVITLQEKWGQFGENIWRVQTRATRIEKMLEKPDV